MVQAKYIVECDTAEQKEQVENYLQEVEAEMERLVNEKDLTSVGNKRWQKFLDTRVGRKLKDKLEEQLDQKAFLIWWTWKGHQCELKMMFSGGIRKKNLHETAESLHQEFGVTVRYLNEKDVERKRWG